MFLTYHVFIQKLPDFSRLRQGKRGADAGLQLLVRLLADNRLRLCDTLLTDVTTYASNKHIGLTLVAAAEGTNDVILFLLHGSGVLSGMNRNRQEFILPASRNFIWLRFSS